MESCPCSMLPAAMPATQLPWVLPPEAVVVAQAPDEQS